MTEFHRLTDLETRSPLKIAKAEHEACVAQAFHLAEQREFQAAQVYATLALSWATMFAASRAK